MTVSLATAPAGASIKTFSKLLHHVSASQVDLYLRCPRLWFFQYVVGIKSPPSSAMQKGTNIHAHMEKWGKTGALPSDTDALTPLIKMGAAAMELEVAKREDLIVEQHFDLPTFDGGPLWTGYIDVLDPNGVDDSAIGEKYDCRVHDYKTISDFRYVKTPDEIKNNLQLLSYAKFCISEEFSIERVAIGHVYLRTKPPARVLMPAPVIVTRDYIEEKWSGYVDIVREMYELAKDAPTSAMDVTPHTDACSAYGGCYFRSDCGMIPTFAQLGTKKKEIGNMSSFAEKLKARANGTTNGAILASAPIAAPAVAQVPLINPPPDFRPRYSEVAAITCMTCEGRKYFKDAEGRFLMCKSCGGKGAIEAVAIISPDAPSRVNEPDDGIAAAPAKKEKKAKKKEEGTKIVIRSESGEVIDPDAPADPYDTATPIELKNNTIEKTTAALNAELAKKRVVSPRKSPMKAPTIYIDTFLVKGSAPRPMPFEEWLAPIVELLSSEMGLPDYGMDFANKANGALFSAIQETLDTLPEYLYVSSSHRAAPTFLEAIIPHAKEVYRGVRA